MDWMHRELFNFNINGLAVTVNAWKLIGYTGVLLFAGRWLVQYVATRKAGKPTINKTFWIMSLVGSVLSLLYFIFGKNDSVGVLSTIFPAFVSAYNLMLQVRLDREAAERRNQNAPAESADTTDMKKPVSFGGLPSLPPKREGGEPGVVEHRAAPAK